MSKVAELFAKVRRTAEGARVLGAGVYGRIRSMSPAERAALYSLPLFVTWAFAFTWDPDPTVLRAARRSLVLALAFLLFLAAIYLAESLVTSLFPDTGYVVGWFTLVLHALGAFAYVGLSLGLAIREWREAPIELRPLDEAAAQIESWAGR